MKKTYVRLLLSGIILLFLNFSASARMDGDVKTTLLDVETDYGTYQFEIHLPKKEENYLNRLIYILKNDTAKLADYFKYAPIDPVHFSLVEDAQSANGSATVFPANYINLRKFPPLGQAHLSSSTDFVKELVLHELIHIIHMDQTRGIVKGVRTVFGSFGKLGGVTPRWFTEGIATWGESALTNGGRLKNNLLKAEWESVINSRDFCKTIDCLDEPGEFPFGQYAYWTGAFFMDYLEGVKPNSVQCLIFANSNNIPFFLNSAFNECFGKSAPQMYGEFRQEIISGINSRSEESSTKLTPISNVLGHKSFQQGMVIIDDTLISVEIDDRVSKIVEQDLKNNNSKEIPFKDSLSFIDKLNKNKVSIKTFSNNRSDTLRDYTTYDLKNLSKSSRRGDYNFIINEKNISLTFNQRFWSINNGEYNFPEEVNISSLSATENGIFFRLFDTRRNKTFAYFYDANNKQIQEGPEVKESFIILDSCSDGVIATESGKLLYITNKNISTIKGPISSRIVAATFGENYSAVVLSNSKSILYKWNVGCRDLKKLLMNTQKTSFKDVELNKFKSLNSDYEKVSYPGARHFVPTHWMLNYSQTTDALSYWSAMTTISDPDQRHTLGLTGVFYSGISEITPEINYSYEFPNDFLISIGHSKTYTSSSHRVAYDSSQVNSASLSNILELGPVDIASALYVSMIDVDDFLSQRKETEYGFILNLSLVSGREDEFVTESSLRMRVFNKDIEGSQSYNGIQSIAKGAIQPFRNFYLGVDLAYSTLDKNDYVSGVIYGGGSYTSYHQFYGISYNDIFGNDIKTMRAHLKYKLLNIYRGSGFIPFFMKEVHLLAGTDLVSADRIYMDNRYLRDSSAQSYWAGVSSDFTVGYGLPLSIDIIRSRVLNRYGEDVDSTISVVKGSVGF